MVKLIIIDKACNLKSSTLKKFDIELLYKKCGLRKNDNFEKRHTWKIDDSNFVSCFSKDKGRESSINKYDLPPPIDNELYYEKELYSNFLTLLLSMLCPCLYILQYHL